MRTLISYPLLATLLTTHAFAVPDFRQLIHQGQAALAVADLPGAETFFLQACDNAEQDTTGNPLSHEMRASCEHHLAIVDEARGDLDKAAGRLRRALLEWPQAGPAFQASYATSLMNLGELYRKLGRLSEAEEHLVHAMNLSRDMQVEHPQVYPEALCRLAGVYVELDKAAQARPLLMESIDAFRRLAPDQKAEEARALDFLGAVDLLEGQNAAGREHFNEAVNLSLEAVGADHPQTASYQADLAMAYVRTGQYDRAEPLLKRARFVIESHPLYDKVRLGTILAELSIVACAHNKPSIAEEYGRRAVEVLDSSPARGRAAGLLAMVRVGSAWVAQHHLEEAERILPEAVLTERGIAPGTCLLADGVRALASLRALQHSWREAGDLYRESLHIYEKRLGPNNALLAPVLKEYAEVLKHSGGSKEEVKKVENQARAILGYLPRG